MPEQQKYPFNLSGKTALVTGSSRGIGRSIACGLAAANAHVIVHGRSHDTVLSEAAHEVSEYGVTTGTVAFDLWSVDSIEQGLESISQPIDILILNASTEIREPFDALTSDSIQKQVDCNLISTIHIVSKVLPKMRSQHWGRIIGIGSVQEKRANPDLSVYAALKAAQSHYLQTVALAVAPEGVTVNTVAPGAILTDRNRDVLSEQKFRQRVEASIPMGRVGDPADCAGAVVFLCSQEAAYITGAWLPVDGGRHV